MRRPTRRYKKCPSNTEECSHSWSQVSYNHRPDLNGYAFIGTGMLKEVKISEQVFI
jgi:hypothetical protein